MLFGPLILLMEEALSPISFNFRLHLRIKKISIYRFKERRDDLRVGIFLQRSHNPPLCELKHICHPYDPRRVWQKCIIEHSQFADGIQHP